MSIGLLTFEQMMEADELRAMSGLGLLAPITTDAVLAVKAAAPSLAPGAVASDYHKRSMTNVVRMAEETWTQVAAGQRSVPADFRGNLDILRQNLTTKRWADSSWTPEFMGGWASSSDLLERVNRIHRLLIARERPGAIAPGVLNPDGSARKDSPTKAGLVEFWSSLPAPPPPETVTNWGKVALGVAALLAVGYASGNLAKLLR